jgi:RNA polymerase sigma-70 factor (ECF subfamily)
VDPALSPEDFLIRQEEAARVRQALGQIPAHYQEALHLKYFEEHTYAEIATQLGLQRNQVAQRIRDGLKAFREAYLRLQREEDYGHDLR